MLTDEELKELEEAVDGYGMFERLTGWTPSAGEKVLLDSARDQIARERAMRQPLTAEVCERLGMVSDQPVGYCKRWQIGELNYVIDIKSQFIGRGLNGASAFAWGNNREPLTVGHLFAAAKLAGVELDWRKVGE